LISTNLRPFLENKGHVVDVTSRNISSGNIHYDISRVAKSIFPDIDNYDCIVFLAAISGEKDCKKNLDYTNLINVIAPCKFLEECIKKEKHFIFISSSSIFDEIISFHLEDSNFNPKGVYASSKYEAEKCLLGHNNNKFLTILRLTKVLDYNSGIISDWVKRINKNQFIYAFSDIFISPISVKKVIAVLEEIINSNLTGVINFGGADEITYSNLSLILTDNFPSSKKLIKIIKARDSSEFDFIQTRSSIETSQILIKRKLLPEPSSDLMKNLLNV